MPCTDKSPLRLPGQDLQQEAPGVPQGATQGMHSKERVLHIGVDPVASGTLWQNSKSSRFGAGIGLGPCMIPGA